MKPNSEELAKAKVRMIRAMIKEGYLNDACMKGFKYTDREYAEARLGLIVRDTMANCELRVVPKSAEFYKEKNIAWKHVQQWTGVQLHQLPLQSYDDEDEDVEIDGVDLLVQPPDLFLG